MISLIFCKNRKGVAERLDLVVITLITSKTDRTNSMNSVIKPSQDLSKTIENRLNDEHSTRGSAKGPALFKFCESFKNRQKWKSMSF